MINKLSSWRIATTIVAVSIIGMAIVLFFTTTTSSAGQPPPGLTAGVSALDRLPPEANVPEEVLEILRAFDPSVIGPLDRAAAKVRKLRASPDGSTADIYAVRSKTGSVCVMVRYYAGMCPAALEAGQPGLLFTLGGGDGTSDLPPVLAGVAADNVSNVDLTVNGSSVPVSLENNTVFAELSTGIQSARVVVHYDGYDDETFELLGK